MNNISIIASVVACILLTIFFIAVLSIVYKNKKSLILAQKLDGDIKENIAYEYSKYNEKTAKYSSFEEYINKKASCKSVRTIITDAILILIEIVALAILVLAISYRAMNEQIFINDTCFLVVETGSMEEKNTSNQYLIENNLNDQIPTNSFVSITNLKDNEEPELYKIYAFYSAEDEVLIHRLIGINEDGNYIFRGDSNSLSLKAEIDVPLGDIIGVYNNDANQALGTTIVFFKSPMGLVVLFLIAVLLISNNVYSCKLNKLIQERYNALYPHASDIYLQYLAIDEEREKSAHILNDIREFESGDICLVLSSKNNLQTGDKVKIIQIIDEKYVLCSLINNQDYEASAIKVAKNNLVKTSGNTTVNK